MTPIGFSTGTLAFSDFRLGISKLRGKAVAAIELSALREEELEPLVSAIDQLELSQFEYKSVHAPSKFSKLTEERIVELLTPVFKKGWPVVVHPDAIQRFDLWRPLGDLVCIENMDKRKPTGRTAEELEQIFSRLPEAALCFDVGHARQIDPSLTEAVAILKRHGSRLRQLHVSEVNSQSRHEALNWSIEQALTKLATMIQPDVPIILETPVEDQFLDQEMTRVRAAIANAAAPGGGRFTAI